MSEGDENWEEWTLGVLQASDEGSSANTETPIVGTGSAYSDSEEEEVYFSDSDEGSFFESDFDDEDVTFEDELSLPGSSQETNANSESMEENDDSSTDDEVEILDPNDNENNSSAAGAGGFVADSADLPEGQGQDDPDEAGSPPRKLAKLDDNVTTSETNTKPVDDGESDGFTCTICYDNFTNSGEHRISCLKCGHVFGKVCIEKWLKIHGRCPQCNCKSIKRDIRILYVKSIQAVDNTDLTEAKRELEKAQITISKCTLENAKMKIYTESLNQQLQMLQKQNAEYKMNTLKLKASASCSTNNPGPSSSITSAPLAVPPSPSKSALPGGRKELKFAFSKHFEIKEGICRVGAYNEWMNMMVVSHEMKNSLYPNGCSGIKQFNMLELRATVSLPIHQKQIRDMQFSHCQNNVLLTVGMDKKAILFNCDGNLTVQTFQTDYPLWSCCWDEVRQHLFYAGCGNGQIITYDIRSPQDPVTTFSCGPDTSPVCRIKFVSPAYQANAFNLSGLLVQKLNSVTFCESRGNNNEMRYHALPLEGPFMNVDFEPKSRHMLVSTRPSRNEPNPYASHLLCDLTQHYSEGLERNVVSSNLIRSYQGTNRDAQRLCRSSIFSPEDGYIFVLANGVQSTVKYWDISLSESSYRPICNAPEFVLDYIHGQVNGTSFLGLVSEKGARVFRRSLAN